MIRRMTGTGTPPKQRGCFFYGCITVSILTVLSVVGIYFGFRYAMKKLQALAEEYTEPTPVAIQVVELPTDRLQALQARLAEFKRAMDAGLAGQTLTLSADEINGLIASAPEVKELKGKAKQAWGHATHDPATHDEGVADEVAGNVEEGFGKARRKVGEALHDVAHKIKD